MSRQTHEPLVLSPYLKEGVDSKSGEVTDKRVEDAEIMIGIFGLLTVFIPLVILMMLIAYIFNF